MFRDHAIATLKAALPELRREFMVQELYLFGSVARGDERLDSDVDVLVEFQSEARPTLMTFGRLQDRLEDLLGRGVDVVENHPYLRPAFQRALAQDRLRVA